MDLTISLSKGDIVLRAKDDTYLSVRSYLMGHDANRDAKYEMQADERATHERKMLNSIGSALSSLKVELHRWRASDTLTEGVDRFTLTLEVSDRIDTGMRSDLSRLVEEYLYRRVVADWWSVNYPDSSAPYYESASDVLTDIKKCLHLLPPYESVDGLRYKCLTLDGCRVIYIYKSELMNDIHSELLKLSRGRLDERGLEDFNLQTSEMDGDGLLSRYVNRFVHRAGERLQAYLVGLSSGVDDNMLCRTPVYVFRLLLPASWDGSLFEQLAEEIHSYVVNSCLYEWLKTYLSDLAPAYGMESERAYENMKHVVTTRKRGFIRKPIQPF